MALTLLGVGSAPLVSYFQPAVARAEDVEQLELVPLAPEDSDSNSDGAISKRKGGRVSDVSRDSEDEALRVSDAVCRFDLNYEAGYIGFKNIRSGSGEHDLTTGQQALDFKFDIGYDSYYSVFGGGVASHDKTENLLGVRPGFSVLKNRIYVGGGKEVNKWYRVEGDVVFVRHRSETLPGLEARFIGDYEGVGYLFVKRPKFEAEVSMIDRIPSLSVTGALDFEHALAKVRFRHSRQEDVIEFCPYFKHDWGVFSGKFGAKFSYSNFKGNDSSFSVVLKAGASMPKVPRYLH